MPTTNVSIISLKLIFLKGYTNLFYYSNNVKFL